MAVLEKIQFLAKKYYKYPPIYLLTSASHKNSALMALKISRHNPRLESWPSAMVAKSPKIALAPMLFIVAYLAVWLPTGLAELSPLPEAIPPSGPFPGETGQCWSSLANIPGCLAEIYGSVASGQLSLIGPACCEAIVETTANCLSELIPFNPVFPTLLHNSCAKSGAAVPPTEAIDHVSLNELYASELSPVLQPGKEDIQQCWSHLANARGCLSEIFGSIFRGRIGSFGLACCEAITKISDSCWTELFPFNPFFPSMLKNYCASSGGAEPSPHGIGQTIWTKLSPPVPLPFPGLPPGQSGPVIERCWSPLTTIEGCIADIYGSLSNSNFGAISPACCKAISQVDDNCWPKMFPFNPLFSPLLKSICASIGTGIAPAPKGI
ncbi:hypothetical protein CJ030_MR6G001693 [Morella rubra]|uniref:Prolamin-like domain-containing protein n=1 Tax=Morella rubra TaxID=262757 RepID=A0A6A1VAP9_9ROSI|nr:hypothetical protein CJ030_MR6G001693 [Morella rubra]